ncbi:hypothetical protein HanIR_Chr12g0587521 [Helianthus annuus]|nr:hypothetical protein HanIR_Chr12g0587521 [Helianthus annuus]
MKRLVKPRNMDDLWTLRFFMRSSSSGPGLLGLISLRLFRNLLLLFLFFLINRLLSSLLFLLLSLQPSRLKGLDHNPGSFLRRFLGVFKLNTFLFRDLLSGPLQKLSVKQRCR